MARVIRQIVDKTAAVKTEAAKATTIAELRLEVVNLSEAVERLEAKIARLDRRRR